MSTEQQTDGQNDDPALHNTSQLIKLCRVLLDQFSNEYNLSVITASRIKLNEFLHWFNKLRESSDSTQIQQYVDRAGVATDYWSHLEALCSCLEGIEQLQRIWPYVALSKRLPPHHKLASVHAITLLRWEDGKAAPLSCFVPNVLANNQGTFHDSDVGTLIVHNSGTMQQMLLDNSLDILHDHRSQPATQDDFELVMGLLLILIDNNGVIFRDVPPAPPNTVQLKLEDGLRLPPERRESCKGLLRVLQGMFSPPLPVNVQQKIAQIRSRNQAQTAEGEKPAGMLGGWDV